MNWQVVIAALLWMLSVGSVAWGAYLHGHGAGRLAGRREQWELDNAERERMETEIQTALQLARTERELREGQLTKEAAAWLERWH